LESGKRNPDDTGPGGVLKHTKKKGGRGGSYQGKKGNIRSRKGKNGHEKTAQWKRQSNYCMGRETGNLQRTPGERRRKKRKNKK